MANICWKNMEATWQPQFLGTLPGFLTKIWASLRTFQLHFHFSPFCTIFGTKDRETQWQRGREPIRRQVGSSQRHVGMRSAYKGAKLALLAPNQHRKRKILPFMSHQLSTQERPTLTPCSGWTSAVGQMCHACQVGNAQTSHSSHQPKREKEKKMKGKNIRSENLVKKKNYRNKIEA